MKFLDGKKAGQGLKEIALWRRLATSVRRMGGYVPRSIQKVLERGSISFFDSSTYQEKRSLEFNGLHYRPDLMKKKYLWMSEQERNYSSASDCDLLGPLLEDMVLAGALRHSTEEDKKHPDFSLNPIGVVQNGEKISLLLHWIYNGQLRFICLRSTRLHKCASTVSHVDSYIS